MPYYVINNRPVFLFTSRWKKLQKLSLKHKDPEFRFDSMIQGTKACKEAQKLMYRFLKSQCEKDSEHFNSEWVKFDITGSEAGENVWDLLYDYSCYYGCSYLSDLREPSQQIIDDYLGNQLQYPMGKIFVFNHCVKPGRWWWKYTRKMTRQTISVIINTDDVIKLTGDLGNFRLYAKSFCMQCNGSSTIISPTLRSERGWVNDKSELINYSKL